MSFIGYDIQADRRYCFSGRDILVDENGLPASPAELLALSPVSVGDSQCGASAFEFPGGQTVPSHCRFIPLRQYFATNSEEEVAVVSRMKALLGWKKATRFCPCCASLLEPHPKEAAMVCPNCGTSQYPKIEPCVIVVIKKGDKILLLKHKTRNQDIYACLAGFVEAGESIEHALRREVREETGLEITGIRYMGSQAWPFPYQLMIGFIADYLSGEIQIQEDEISEALWCDACNLPNIPAAGSISRYLIEYACDEIRSRHKK